MSPERTGKISTYFMGTQTAVWNRCSYQVPEMVETNNSTKEENDFNYSTSTVQAISRGVGDRATKVVSTCARFVEIISPVKTQVENGSNKLFNFWG